MKSKLMVALFSVVLFSTGAVNAATRDFSYQNILLGDSSYHVMAGGTGLGADDGLGRPGDVQANEVPSWLKKLFPWISGAYTFVEIMKEYGIPAFDYVRDKFSEWEITSNCNFFYQYEDYLDGEMDDEEKEDYEGSMDFEDHEALSSDEYSELKDFCHANRPRP